MNKKILFYFFCLFFSKLSLASPFNLTLDAGHGGNDRGAIQGRLTESELVLDITLQVKALLAQRSEQALLAAKSAPLAPSSSADAIQLLLTRESDKTVSLSERVEKANLASSQLYVSIHANSNPSRIAEGAEFYFRESQTPLLMSTTPKNQDPKADATELEQILGDLRSQGQLRSSLLFSHHLKENWHDDAASAAVKEENKKSAPAKIKRAPFFVVSHTNMPSVLIEVGFMTNPNELRKLNSPEYRRELAQKIYKSIVAYKESVDKPRSQSLE